MRLSAALFGVVLAAAAAAWAVVIRPMQEEARAAAAEVARQDLRGGREAAGRYAGPDAAEARRLEAALASFLAVRPAVPRPAGLQEESPGVLAGRLPWVEVQDVLAWAAAQDAQLASLEIRAVRGDGDRADCRAAFAEEGGR
jgi:hypothetical protein